VAENKEIAASHLTGKRRMSCHTELYELVTSLLIRGIPLIGLITHVIWADSLYFLYLMLLSISKIIHPSLLYNTFCRYLGLILVFLEDPLLIMSIFTELSATFTGNSYRHTVPLVVDLLLARFPLVN
jgi:hypothetical protein